MLLSNPVPWATGAIVFIFDGSITAAWKGPDKRVADAVPVLF
ncbi:hypothetical protein [Pseudomonas fluorescens]|nr:hypothetical protein [Pseudomonas fluorescens]